MSEEDTTNIDAASQGGTVMPSDPPAASVVELTEGDEAATAAPEAAPVEAIPEVVSLETPEPATPGATELPQPAIRAEPEAAPVPALESAPDNAAEPQSVVMQPPLALPPEPRGRTIDEGSPEPEPASLIQPAPEVREVIIEKEKPLTDADKEAIFEERLKGHLTDAQRTKRDQYEKHLQEIVDFIRSRGTLVTNQDIEEGLRIPDTTVTDRLNVLIRRGLVVRLGDQRHAKYKLASAL